MTPTTPGDERTSPRTSNSDLPRAQSSEGDPLSSPERAPEGRPAQTKPKAWVRALAAIAVLATAWHILASFLWIAPYSENAREVVPGTMLTSYMIPFFGQSWSVFAPEPINGDYHFNVRAVLSPADGQEEVTGWVSATDVELSMLKYNLFPPRAGIQSSELASSYKGAFDGMGDVDRAVIGGDFTVNDWEVGLRAALEQQETADGSSEEAREKKISELLAQEHRSTAYATQVARAIWGEDVTQVQYRVSRQNIIPFAQRHDPAAVRPEPMIVLPGWRGPIENESQNDGNFGDVFRSQFERITR